MLALNGYRVLMEVHKTSDAIQESLHTYSLAFLLRIVYSDTLSGVNRNPVWQKDLSGPKVIIGVVFCTRYWKRLAA